jgi:uncharacterized protein (DUF1786 family)
MIILAIDIGTGTQDILLFDSKREVENNYKLVMPAPTVMFAERIRAATAQRHTVILTGVLMGGGPVTWAAEAHIRAGYPLYATPDAARTFNDDLAAVSALGVRVVSTDEAHALSAHANTTTIVMRDLDLEAIRAALGIFGVPCQPDIAAVAVFDHGNAPPGYSDRQFRFDYLQSQIAPGVDTREQLARFAFRREAIPEILTRFQAVAQSANFDGQMVLMDTAPAAVLGALEDERVGAPAHKIVVNVGNFHTLAFRLGPAGIAGLFEHHTGELAQPKLEAYLRKLAEGTLSHQEVFADMGHGALMLDATPRSIDLVAITGPRWGLLRGAALKPYFAAPYGDMMLAGCYGLVRACAYVLPEAAEMMGNRLNK